MPSLLEYINQLQQEHRYRVKMIFSPSEKQLEVLERHLKKYDALEVSRPEKLMLQSKPMDFPQYAGHEVVIVDVVTRLPVSHPTLEAELRGLLFVPEGTLRVIGRDEPSEKETSEKKTAPITGTDYSEAEANAISPDQVAGDKYNQNLLKDLDNARKDVKASIVKTEVKSDSKDTGPDFEAKQSASPLSGAKNPKMPKGDRK